MSIVLRTYRTSISGIDWGSFEDDLTSSHLNPLIFGWFVKYDSLTIRLIKIIC